VPKAEGDAAAERALLSSWQLAEVLGSGLLLIFGVLVVTGVASGILTETTFGPQQVNGVTGFFSADILGQALRQATFWSEPQLAALFIMGSLGLAWWQLEAWSPEDEDEAQADTALHMRRAANIVKGALAASVLCIAGGVLFTVGLGLQSAPTSDWMAFVESCGVTLGSLILGAMGIFASRRLLNSRTLVRP
jgi:hypothetical protein